jgi:hypothetical protein|tara:strand:- start:824 stop:1168 length:345 start_codon:yes stop_codon:yes gene_type:complete
MTNILSFDADDSVNINGTSLQGTIKATYLELCEVFGKPTYTDADPYEKVNAEWAVQARTLSSWADDEEDAEDSVFTIYNWKMGYIPTEEYDWHIGGKSYEAVDIATTILKDNLS